MTDESVFAAALALPTTDRRAYLDRACADNPALRREVEALLAAHAASNPLDRPADLGRTDAYAPAADARGSPMAAVGDRIDQYKLMERIGEGGMGEVWVADQLEPIRRRVALKVIKPGMDSRGVLARFEAERQALALMDHPNIARVLDAGTTADGRPFFAMELVKGVPITDYCDARKLTPKERLELFVPVCQAIQHAHQKGVIHRDVKPSNVLVELHDDRPVPKVIDFGVAKAVGQSLTEKTIYTGLGALVGTPAYMAPEQASFNALDIDTRADVYALGVLLYELLAGSPPFEPERLKRAALDEVLRMVREEDPPKPSARLSTSEARATIAAVRQSDPARLSKLMRGELDWIVMKALEKERARRYDSAAGLARDVQRYLADEPVEACPPSLTYRVRKAYRRHRGAVSTAIFVACGLLGAATYAGYEASRANRNGRFAILAANSAIHAREEAERERDEKKAALVDREAALRQAQGLHLTLRSELVRPQNPGLALTLAVEGARRNPGLFANNTLTAALDACYEERTLFGHEGTVRACAFSPDGLRVVTGGDDRTARVWDAATGRELLKLGDHEQPVVFVAYSPDGRRLLTVASHRTESRGGTEGGSIKPVVARLWEAATGRLVATWRDPPAGTANRSHFRLTHVRAGFSPDGRRVVTTFAVWPDGAPQVRDAATGELIFTLDRHTDPVADVAYSPDGKWIATASTDKTAVIWDADTGKPVHTVRHPFGIAQVAFRPDGKRLLTVGNGVSLSRSKTTDGEWISGVHSDREDSAGRVWDVATGKEVAVLKWPDNGKAQGYGGAFSPDGTRIVTTGEHYRGHWGPHGFPWVWDAVTGQPLVREVGREGEGVISDFARFSPDGGRWLLTLTERTAYLRDAATGKTRTAYRGHEDTIRSAAFSPDGRRVVTAGADGTARLWTADLGPDAAARLGDWPDARGVAISPDGRALIELPSCRLWDLAAGRLVATLAGPAGEVWRAGFALDGSKLWTVARDHNVRLWNARTGEALAVLDGHTAQVPWVAFDPTGARVATASFDGSARVWDAATGKEMARLQKTDRTKTNGTLDEVPQFVGRVAFSPDGRRVAGSPGASAHWVAGVWDAATGAEERVLRYPGNWNGSFNNEFAWFLPDGRLLTGQPAGVWDFDTARVAVPLQPADFDPNVLSPSPDGRWVAAAHTYGRQVVVFDLQTGQAVHTLSGHGDGVTALSFNRDGTLLASGSQDGTARVWDLSTGAERLTVPHPGVVSVEFTPDGRRLLTSGRGARLWAVDPLAAAEARRPRDLTASERARFGLEP